MGPNLNFTAATSMIVVALTSSSREELDHFITSVNSFHPSLKYTWEISETSIAFLDIKVSINGDGLSTSVHYKPTDSHNYLLHPSSHPSHVKNSIQFSHFLDFDVYALMTPIFPTNQRKCAISSRSVTILILLSTRLNTVLNRLIDSQHCKRHRRKRTREFHLHSLTIHITSQPKTSF